MEEEEEIRDYISGFMTEPDKRAFEKRIELDTVLKKQVEHSRRIKHITDEDKKVFSNNVLTVIRKNRRKKTNNIFFVAASVSILLSMMAWYSWLQPSTPLPQLVDSYLEPFPDIVTVRSNKSALMDLSAYRAGDYEQAAQVLQKHFEVHEDSLSGLYLGVSYLLINQPTEAHAILSRIDREDLLFKADLTWYLGLSLIKIKRKEEAQVLLKELIRNKTSYASKASKLLNAYQE